MIDAASLYFVYDVRLCFKFNVQVYGKIERFQTASCTIKIYARDLEEVSKKISRGLKFRFDFPYSPAFRSKSSRQSGCGENGKANFTHNFAGYKFRNRYLRRLFLLCIQKMNWNLKMFFRNVWKWNKDDFVQFNYCKI